jgi:phosphatidylinositol dimannoside acyltransferase
VDFSRLRKTFDDLVRYDSVFWRRAINAGVTYGPAAFVRYSPPLFGLAFCATLAQKRAIVRRNLRLAAGPQGPLRETVEVARVFMNYASCLTDAFVAGSGRPEKLVARSVCDHHFTSAEREGKGVIVATAHTGGWQSASAILRTVHETDILVAMRRERDPRAQALTDHVRDRAGMRLVHVGDDPLDALHLLGHLRKKGVIALQIDRLPQGMRGRKVLLFGEPFVLPEGPFRLAAASGAPIIPVFTRRVRYMEYEVQIAPPIRVSRRPSAEELDRAAGAVAREMESFVRKNPTQWFHFE